ncbi:hypothetical protein JCM8097_002642 [Rhodosporidiobolus ruineniae]
MDGYSRPPAGYNPPPAPGAPANTGYGAPPPPGGSPPHGGGGAARYGQDRADRRPGPYDRPAAAVADQGWGARSSGPGGGGFRRSASPEFDSRGRRIAPRAAGGQDAPAGYGPPSGGYGGVLAQAGGGGGYGGGSDSRGRADPNERMAYGDPYRRRDGPGGGPPGPGGAGGYNSPGNFGGPGTYGGPPPGQGGYGGGPPGGYGGPPGGGGGGYGGPPRGGFGGGGYGGGGGGGFDPAGPPRAGRFSHFPDRDESQVIRDRVNRERPCRTLFVRNLKYGLAPEDVRAPFAQIGDIKTFFDLLDKRAMAFITYYDSRAAMMAKDRLHNFHLMGRPMDVHFSLPRDADLAQECDREKGQGTLSILLRNAPPGTPAPSDQEIYQRFAPFGDIKSVFPSPKRPDMKFIEFFDSRACVQAYDRVNHSPLAGGIADLHFEWDVIPPAGVSLPPAPTGPPGGFQQQGPPQSGGYGGAPGGGGYGGGPGGGTPQGYNAPAAPSLAPPGAPGSAGHNSPYPGPPPGAAPYSPYGAAPPSAAAPTAAAGGASPYPGPPPGAAPYNPYGAPPPPAAPAAAASASNVGEAHGMEQAKKMQELLASLVANPGALQTALSAVNPGAAAAAPASAAPAQQQPQEPAAPSYPAYNPPPAVSAPAESTPAPTPADHATADSSRSPLPPAIGSPTQPTSSGLPAAVTSLLAHAGAGPTPPSVEGTASSESATPAPSQAPGGYSPLRSSSAVAAPQSPEKPVAAGEQVEELLKALQQQPQQPQQ